MKLNKLFFNSRSSFVEYFLKDQEGVVLDVGNLGDGKINVDINGIVTKNGGKYFGLDCNKNLASHLKLENQLIGDLHCLDNVESGKFDCIYAGEIIEHSWQPNLMIKECHRILKDGGILIIDTPNVYDFVKIGYIFLKNLDTMGDNKRLTYNEAKDNFKNLREEGELCTQPQHKIFYTPAMLEQLLNMHGFKVENIVSIGKPRNLIHKLLLKIFPMGSQKLGVIAIKEDLDKIYKDFL